MDCFRPHKRNASQAGIALFMVIAAMTLLSLLVTEFTYITQVNQRMAFDSLDQIKAYYLAKTGLKLSLLRLKAYQNLKGALGNSSQTPGAPTLPKKLLDQIWEFPIVFPPPTNLPNLTTADKERIEKFKKDSGLEGTFTSKIDSESNKHNLNSLLPTFAPKAQPSASPQPSPSPSPQSSPQAKQTTSPTQTANNPFDPDAAQKALGEFLFQILDQKFQADPEFANDYRDLKLDDLLQNLTAWVDQRIEPTSQGSRKQIKPKKGPFYSLSELHMIYPMDDRLFDVLAPNFTVSTTSGINVNSMSETVLRAMASMMTKEEVEAFFKHRDSTEDDNQFKDENSFFDFLHKNVAALKNEEDFKKFKEDLTKRNIRIITEESNFKITVRSQVNQASRIIEAWVTLGSVKSQSSTNAPPLSGPGSTEPQNPTAADTGLTITFMKIQ